MSNGKDKTTFIRKNGKVIPVNGGKNKNTARSKGNSKGR